MAIKFYENTVLLLNLYFLKGQNYQSTVSILQFTIVLPTCSFFFFLFSFLIIGQGEGIASPNLCKKKESIFSIKDSHGVRSRTKQSVASKSRAPVQLMMNDDPFTMMLLILLLMMMPQLLS